MTAKLSEEIVCSPDTSVTAVPNEVAARGQILQELVDALIQENLFDFQKRGVLVEASGIYQNVDNFFLAENEYYFRYALNGGTHEVVFRIKKQQQVQPFRCSRLPVLLIELANINNAECLDATQLMQCLVGMADPAALPDISGLDRFMHDLAIAEAQTGWTLASAATVISAIQRGETDMLAWERLAALRDRPFHPLARAKTGWDADQCRFYNAEAAQTFGLDWVALRNEYLVGNPELRGMAVPDKVLSETEKHALCEAMAVQRIDLNRYSVIPVHPWQMRHIIASEFADDIAEGNCVVVATALGRFSPTSSIRSLAPVRTVTHDVVCETEVHVKLPVAIASLGALRILPPRYLHNGAVAQAVIASIIKREPSLSNIECCDETQWIGFSSEGETMLSDRSGHLTCVLRRYPRLNGPDCYHVPMSAFTHIQDYKVPAYERVVSDLGNIGSGHLSAQESVLNFFEDLCNQLCILGFTCFGYGVMPEVHGQNLVLAIEQGRVRGLVLRDHDTLRIFPPWMRQRDLGEVQYIMDWSTPNSLVCLSPQELLRYFQTLGVQVNLYAIADTFARAYGIDLIHFWRTIKYCCQRQLQDLDLPVFAKAILRKELLDSSVWPTRQLLTPYLVKRTQKTGMPSSTGFIPNPLVSDL